MAIPTFRTVTKAGRNRAYPKLGAGQEGSVVGTKRRGARSKKSNKRLNAVAPESPKGRDVFAARMVVSRGAY